jgi:hypothetical protein
MFWMALGAVAAVAGIGMQAKATADASKAAKTQADAQAKAEELRKKQMELDAARQRREVIRQSIIARATATANANAQGAGQSSGLQGALSQIQGRAAEGVLGINQGEAIGKGIFDANAAGAQAGGDLATAQGLGSLGGAIFSSSQEIHRVGNYFATPKS